MLRIDRIVTNTTGERGKQSLVVCRHTCLHRCICATGGFHARIAHASKTLVCHQDGHTPVTWYQLTHWEECRSWGDFTAAPFTTAGGWGMRYIFWGGGQGYNCLLPEVSPLRAMWYVIYIPLCGGEGAVRQVWVMKGVVD